MGWVWRVHVLCKLVPTGPDDRAHTPPRPPEDGVERNDIINAKCELWLRALAPTSARCAWPRASRTGLLCPNAYKLNRREQGNPNGLCGIGGAKIEIEIRSVSRNRAAVAVQSRVSRVEKSVLRTFWRSISRRPRCEIWFLLPLCGGCRFPFFFFFLSQGGAGRKFRFRRSRSCLTDWGILGVFFVPFVQLWS